MKRINSLLLALMVALFSILPNALAVSTYKYSIEIVDDRDNPVTTGASVRVKTVNTNTDASVWPNDDTSTGTLSGAVTPDSNGFVNFYSTAASHDVVIQFRGKLYVYKGVTPGSDRKVTVERDRPKVDLDNNQIASASSITVPLFGNLFQVTGTTNIDNIATSGHQIGKEIQLLFTGTSLQVGENGNITLDQRVKTSGSLVVGAGTVLELVWDGTKWRVK